MNDFIKTGIKTLITGGMMVACEGFATYHLPLNASSTKKFLCSVAGTALGFAIGREVASDVIWAISDAIEKGDK